MDATFWALVGLVVFVGVLAYFKVPKMILDHLDGRSEKIGKEIDEARRLREEAQAVLAEYKRKRQEAEKEAEAIIAEAKLEAERLTEATNIALEEMIARRTKAAEEKISQAEINAVAEVRTRAIDLATEAAENIIKENMTGETADDFVKKSISQVSTNLN